MSSDIWKRHVSLHPTAMLVSLLVWCNMPQILLAAVPQTDTCNAALRQLTP